MKNPTYRILPSLCSSATRLLFAAASLTMMAAANADSGNNTTTAYVDSIHQWGAWELDIEPAAGGLQQAGTQALNARDSRVSLRTNSVSALARNRSPVIFTPSAPIVPNIVPVTPPPPPVTPPIGGPADGLF